MASPIKAPVKITKPRMKLILNRERLFTLLDKYRERPFIWVTGPAGSGKTTLASSYVENRKLSYIWYKIDENDADAANVFYYLRLATRIASHSKKFNLSLFTPEYVLGLPAFTKRFFENMFESIGKPSMVVMDNFKNSAKGALPEILHNAISVVPEGISLVVLSRTKPPSFMARAIANQKVQVLGWENLKINLDETTLLVKRVYQKNLPDPTVHQLYKKTDGWIAGLILLMSQTDIENLHPQFLGRDTPEIIFDYFASEVLENVPKETQNFLMATSMLPRITVEMAKALTGHGESQSILEKLYSDNFFTFKHRGNPAFYNYHALFQEFLIARANEQLPPEMLVGLKSKAASLLESSGSVEDAVDLYRQIGEHKPLFDLIIRNAPNLIVQGRHRTLQHWINSLPEEMIEGDPWLLYWQATSIFPFKIAESRPIYEKAFYLFELKNNAEGIILSLCGIFYSIGLAFDSFELFDKWLARLREYRLRFAKQLSEENKALLTTSAIYALVLRTPRYENSSEWRSEAHSLLDQNIDFGIQIQLMLPLAYFYLFSGELPKAESLLKTFNQRAATQNVTPFLKIILGNGNTFYSWLAADFDSCYTSCQETLKLTEDTGIYGMTFFILAHGAAGALSTGDLKRAQELLDKMESQLSYVGAWSQGLFYNLSFWRDLINKDLVRAKHNSDLALKYSEASGSALTSAAAHWASALVLNFSGKRQQADHRLEKALNLSNKFGSQQIKFGCLLTKARFAFERKEDIQGVKNLENALLLGSQKGFFNTFFWLSDAMSFLCGKALEVGIQESYVREIISKRYIVPPNNSIHLASWPYPIRIYTLGRFDIHVDGTPIVFKRKAPKKPLFLLKTLAAFGGREVSNDLILDALWPELDGDAAHNAFTSCVHRLRKLLDNEQAIRVRDGKISLNHKICWLDLWTYEKLISQAESLWLDVTDKDRKSEDVKLTEKIMAQYRGVFLPDDSSSWIITMRERLNSSFLSCLRFLIQFYEIARKWDNAVKAYKRGINVDPLAEDFYRGLMRCYGRLERPSEIKSTYRICQANLSTHAGLKPSQETVDLYRSLI